MTKKEAIEKYNTRWWETATPLEIAKFQANEERLCMPFDKFQEAVETVLERPILTHQMIDPKVKEAVNKLTCK